MTSLIDITATLPGSPTLTTNIAVLGCVGIEFLDMQIKITV